jgi:DNA-directed RNA polymerase subunit RPC12/RpoP
MRGSRFETSFVCADCHTGMNRVEDVPVLRSLVGHAVHRCGQCGHILLVQENEARDWSVRWLRYLSTERRHAITCVPLQ